MGFADELMNNVTGIFKERWNNREGRDVPSPENISLGKNEGVEIEGTVLYADIDGSTQMVDTFTRPSLAAEVYKAYLSCAAKIIESEGGVITAYDGDRIMAVYFGEYKNTRATKSGMKIYWATNNIINASFAKCYPDSTFLLKQNVGIDTSRLLVVQAGVRGAKDLVWVGRAANHAAKLSSIGNEYPYCTFITKAVYDVLNDEVKYSGNDKTPMWEERRLNSEVVYRSSWTWRLPND